MYSYSKYSYLLIKILLIFFYLFQSRNVNGQEKSSDVKINNSNSKIIDKQWEIGSDLLWLIDKNNLPKKSIFIKKHFYPNKNIPEAFRLRMGINLKLFDSTQIEGRKPHNLKIFNPFIRAGYEWQILKKNYQFFFGGDIHLDYRRVISKREERFSGSNGNASNIVIFTNRKNKWEIGMVGFGGIKFYLNSYLSLSTETSINLLYTRIRNNRIASENPPDNTGTEGEDNVDEFTLNFYPLYVINFNVHF